MEIVVAVEKSPNYGFDWTWVGGPGFTLFAVDGNTQYYHAYVCTASEAGQHQTFWGENKLHWRRRNVPIGPRGKA